MTAIGRRGLMASAAAALAAPAIRRAEAAAAQKLVFGGSVPLSGVAAETGLNVHNGYRIAVKYLNEVLGGVEIAGRKYFLELRMFDDASDPSRAVTLIQRQIDEGVDFFLGSFGSNIVLPTVAITESAEKPMVQAGGGSDQIFTQGYRYVFGVYPRASRQFVSTATWLKTLNPPPRTISIISTNDAFSKPLARGAIADCKAHGIEVLDHFELPAQVTDVSGVMASIRARTPDVLACTTHDQDSLLLTKQMIATGTNVKMLYQDLGPQLGSYRAALGKYADGITFQQYWDPRVTFKDKFFGSARNFAEYYAKNITRPIAYHCAAAAACIITYVQAMQAAKSVAPRAVRDALAAIDIETLYHHVKFTPEGDGDPVVMGPGVGQVQHGGMEFVFPEAGKTANVIYPMPRWDQRG
jgi:branched-chain amino acid transport system substrate-binding protein